MEILSQLYKKNIRCYLLVFLIALELLMSFSFLGYIHIEPISITIAYIPVLLAGALVGLPEAVILGGVFGVSSMWKAGANYVMPLDQLFSPFMSGYPLESLLLSVGSRMLFGLLIGLLYLAAKRVRFTSFWIFLISFFGKFIHSFLVYSAMGLLFPETGYHAGSSLQEFDSVSNIVTNLITGGIIVLLWRIENSRLWQEFRLRVEKVQRFQMGEHYHRFSLVIVILLTICFTMAVAVYFVNRMDYVLNQSGIILTDVNYSDLIHLQMQFLIGILSMMVLVIIFLIFNRKYATYMNYKAKTDALTGIMTRQAFFQACRKAMRETHSDIGISGYFIMVDIDYFKEINDRYGHPEGDRVLKITAQKLHEIFGRDGLTGRVGGDEFAVFLYMPISRESLETNLKLFLERIHNIGAGNHRLSCSIGAISLTASKTVEDYYVEADRMLYAAKKRGRDQYVIDNPDDTVV